MVSQQRSPSESRICSEHNGRTKAEMYHCHVCGAAICRDCAVVLKKHDPCPKYQEDVVERVLGPIVRRMLDRKAQEKAALANG